MALVPGPALAAPPGPAGPVFEGIHDVLDRVSPAATQAAEAIETLNDALVQAMIQAGSQAESLEPFIAQAASALAALRVSLDGAVAAAAPALTQLEVVGETGAGELSVVTTALDAALREQAATLETAYGSLGPALSPACEANAQLPIAIGLLPYGFALGGVFDPLTAACVGVPPPPAPPTDQLQPALDQYAALLEGAGYAFDPVAGLLQPAFESVCTGLVLVQTASIFVTLPFSSAAFVDPALRFACDIGGGVSAASPALVFVSVASEPFVPLIEDGIGTLEVLTPILDPLRPILTPSLAGVCNTVPASEQLGPLLPVGVPVEPSVFVATVNGLLCLPVTVVLEPGGGGETPGVTPPPSGSTPVPVVPLDPGIVPRAGFVRGTGSGPGAAGPGTVAAPRDATRVATTIGGLSPRLWAPFVPVAFLAMCILGWVRWKRAMARIGSDVRKAL